MKDGNGNWIRISIPGLCYLPFDIVAFIEDSIEQSSTPLSGPCGNYEGAGRKEAYIDT